MLLFHVTLYMFTTVLHVLDWLLVVSKYLKTHINPPGEKSSRWGELKAPEEELFVPAEALFFSSEIQWDSHQSETFLEAETEKKHVEKCSRFICF